MVFVHTRVDVNCLACTKIRVVDYSCLNKFILLTIQKSQGCTAVATAAR